MYGIDCKTEVGAGAVLPAARIQSRRRGEAPCSKERMNTPVAHMLVCALLCSPVVATAQAPARWTIDPAPVVTIGASEADTNDLLTVVAGAIRLPDGRILVGDRAEYSLRLFSAAGKPVRQFGRKGAGPGEFGHLTTLLRCGDSLVTTDIDGQRVSVFSLAGVYVRSFRFGSPQPARSPYSSVCNRAGTFAHYGWENITDVKAGGYRASVPFWLSGTDSGVRRVVGSYPGSERYGVMRPGGGGGSAGPLPLGKQPAIALASDQLYIGSADRYEIMVFDLSGKQVTTIRKSVSNLETTSEDIQYAIDKAVAGRGPEIRARIERSYAEMQLPKTIPAYAALKVDARDNLWVQDYPRTKSPVVQWTVFDPRGREIAAVALPVHLEAYEIGDDYVLGRFMDPEESIPQVRLYRLHRR
jgi:hypothetical protein